MYKKVRNTDLEEYLERQSIKAVTEINRLAKKSIEVKYGKKLSFDIVPSTRLELRYPVYNGGVFPSWEGHFRIVGDQEVREIIYHGGLGAKTNCGFGCIDIVS